MTKVRRPLWLLLIKSLERTPCQSLADLVRDVANSGWRSRSPRRSITRSVECLLVKLIGAGIVGRNPGNRRYYLEIEDHSLILEKISQLRR